VKRAECAAERERAGVGPREQEEKQIRKKGKRHRYKPPQWTRQSFVAP
jgi:hypothetical protein